SSSCSSGWRRSSSLGDELDQRFLGAVATPGGEAVDARVAAGTRGVLRRDLVHQLALDLVVVDLARDEAPGVEVAAAGGGDELLHVRLEALGLGQGGLDAAVPQQGGRLAAGQGDPVAAGAVELAAAR